MCALRTSATNNAQIYNITSRPDNITLTLPDLKLSHAISTEHVWNAFFTYALLREHEERSIPLELVHNTVNHMERLRPALQARNAYMAGPGQEEWSHACNLCCWVHENDDGNLGAPVIQTYHHCHVY